MDRRERALIAAALAALAVLPIAVFLLRRDDGEERPAAVTHGCSAEEKATEAKLAATPSPAPMGPNLDYEEMNRQGRAATAQPYVGLLCGFEIVARADEAQPHTYCRGKATGRDGHDTPLTPLPSELNKAGLREQAVCDGTEVYATYGNARRSYFRDTPKLDFVANRELLRVIDSRRILSAPAPVTDASRSGLCRRRETLAGRRQARHPHRPNGR